MARPREFDESIVLDAAMQCFWENGYDATSVRDLARMMGLTSASLYNAFGTKRDLYRRALDYYIAQGFSARAKRFESTLPPRDAIRAFFAEIIALSIKDKQRKGCMLVNSALEVAPHDPEFRRVVAAVLRNVKGFFLRSVEAGQKNGTISRLHGAGDLAELLLTVLLGMRVQARVNANRDSFERLIRPVFGLMDDL
jgi:TetR/AcrR family transcriptional regulator, transcriptional repressor for nem operon